MNYGIIKTFDIADGPGVRVSLFVSGCSHHCKECFQPETWAFDYGEPFDEAAKEQIFKAMEPNHIKGFTLLGGEPFEPENQRALVPFLKEMRERFPNKDIWCYTGFVLEGLLGQHPRERENRAHCEVTEEMLSCIDVLVDGEFQLEKKNIMLKFRGSQNQRIIDMRKTREAGTVVLSPLND